MKFVTSKMTFDNFEPVDRRIIYTCASNFRFEGLNGYWHDYECSKCKVRFFSYDQSRVPLNNFSGIEGATRHV